MKNLLLDGNDLGVIHAKKVVNQVRIWLTKTPDASWWVVVSGPDERVHVIGFVRPPQEPRARDTYDALSMASVLEIFLRDADVLRSGRA